MPGWMDGAGRPLQALSGLLARDPEKACPGLDPRRGPVFGKDHAQTKTPSGIAIQTKLIPLQALQRFECVQAGVAMVATAGRSPWAGLWRFGSIARMSAFAPLAGATGHSTMPSCGGNS